MACLACESPVFVAGTEDAESSSKKSRKAKKENSDTASERDNVFVRMAEVREEMAEPPPVLPFLSTITFPWYPETMFCWVMLSAGCAAVMLLFVSANWCWATGGVMSRAGYALGFPLGWLSIFTFSYLAACSTAIISETAAGSDRVSGWPDPDWRDWFWTMMRYAPAVGAAAAAAYGVGLLAQLTNESYRWPAIGVTMLLLTPIFILSTLDSGAVMTLLTPLITGSLVRRWWAWLRFYAMCFALAVFWPGTLLAGYSLQPFYAAAVTAPLMAAVLLIYARLLGRLAWAIGN